MYIAFTQLMKLLYLVICTSSTAKKFAWQNKTLPVYEAAYG
jgi:hypothetical protein